MTRPSFRARSRARSHALAALGSLALLGAVLVPAAQMPAGAISDCGLEGEGTQTVPYLVGSAADLAKVGVGDCGLDAHYLQIDDIELEAPSTAPYNHTPIAPDYSASFSGTYDGDGYRISGLTQVLDGTMWCEFGTCFGGLFGNVIGATLRDVHVVDVSITGSVGSAVGNIGALAGFIQDVQVLNSSSTGTIAVAGDAAAGGLIGDVLATNGAESVVRYSFSEVDISNPEAYYVGGLVGSFNNFSQGNARLEDSYARGDVSVDSSAGGLVGELTRGAAHVVSRSYSTGAVVASGLRFGAADDGGLVGGPRPGTVEASSLWSEELSGLATTVGGGTKVTAAQMRDIQTFLDAGWTITPTCTLAGFDAATAVWGICPDLNDGFPFLLSTRDRRTASDAPTSLTGVAGDGQVTVSWVAPASDGGSAITSSTVTAAPDGATCTAAGAATSCVVSGLTNGTAYTFTVVATNDVGDSEASDPSAPVTPLGAPGQPTGVSGDAGDGEVTASWTAPASDGGSAITGYTVTASPGSATCSAMASATSCVVTGLTNGTAYTFTVVATNSIGTSDPSVASAAVTPVAPVVEAPDTGSGSGSTSDAGSTSDSTSGQGGRAPVLVGGAAPSVPAGGGELVRADGSRVALTVSSAGPGEVRYSADGIEVTFTGGPGSGVAGGLVVENDGEIDCEVCIDAVTGEEIAAWMFSDPRLVAVHRADDGSCQRFTVSVASPLDGLGPVSAGAHTLQLTVPTEDGMQAVNVGLTVGGPVPTEVPSGEGAPGVPAPLGLLLAALVSVAGAVLVGRRALVTTG